MSLSTAPLAAAKPGTEMRFRPDKAAMIRPLSARRTEPVVHDTWYRRTMYPSPWDPEKPIDRKPTMPRRALPMPDVYRADAQALLGGLPKLPPHGNHQSKGQEAPDGIFGTGASVRRSSRHGGCDGLTRDGG